MSTGDFTAADRGDRLDPLGRPEYQLRQSPIFRAVWEAEPPRALFESAAAEEDSATSDRMESLLNCVGRHRQACTLFDDRGLLREELLAELGRLGLWGLMIDPAFGGSGVSFRGFSQFLTRLAAVCSPLAGFALVHHCVGPANAIATFGTDEQRRRLLPPLAGGERLGCFALTEPGAGSDLTAIKTTAVRHGDNYLVNGEKLFITNAAPGRIVALVCLIDGQPAMLIGELSEAALADGSLQWHDYGQYAVKHSTNRGFVLKNFRIPAANRLLPSRGDGLAIAYHGLNRGRAALCANAAGSLRRLLADLLPWVKQRATFGKPIGEWPLVAARIGRLTCLIVACDALAAWTATLLDRGYRGELECIVAKVFAAEALKEAAIEIALRTHGGRSFLHGHPLGDNLHSLLTPCIYEGENELLGLALFHSLASQRPSPQAANSHETTALAWLRPTSVPDELRQVREEIIEFLELSGSQWLEEQCRMLDFSRHIQKHITAIVVNRYLKPSSDPAVRKASELCVRSLLDDQAGCRPGDHYFHDLSAFGRQVLSNEFPSVQPKACESDRTEKTGR